MKKEVIRTISLLRRVNLIDIGDLTKYYIVYWYDKDGMLPEFIDKDSMIIAECLNLEMGYVITKDDTYKFECEAVNTIYKMAKQHEGRVYRLGFIYTYDNYYIKETDVYIFKVVEFDLISRERCIKGDKYEV